jgi:hypothetical protein
MDMFDVVEGIAHASMPPNKEAMLLRHKLADMSRSDFRRFLQATLTDMTMVERIARNSYSHTNGFLKIPLLQKGDARLRLHVWGSGLPDAENVHDHRWVFAGRILVGNMQEQRFMKAADGVEFPAMRYQRPVDRLAGKFAPTANYVVAELAEVNHSEDDTYAMSSDTFHCITSSYRSDLLVTLVLTGIQRRAYSHVLNVLGRPPKPDLPRGCISTDRLVEVFSMTLRLI